MDNEMLELLRYRYDRAVETLEVAKELFEKGKYKDANNRSYYAAYYAMRAVYTLQGKDLKSIRHFLLNLIKNLWHQRFFLVQLEEKSVCLRLLENKVITMIFTLLIVQRVSNRWKSQKS